MTTPIRLVPIDEKLSRHLKGGAAGLALRGAIGPAEVVEIIRGIVDQTLSMPDYVSWPAPWGGYLAVDEAAREIVGACGFKGPPDEADSVEIAYFTLPPFEGKGFATAMASALIELAARAGDVHKIVAHTMPEENASAHVLRKNGLRFVGEVIDPADGLIWRWERVLAG